MPKGLLHILEEEAQRKRTNINRLILATLEKYAEWDRHAERIGYCNDVPQKVFIALLESTEPETIVRIAKESIDVADAILLEIGPEVTMNSLIGISVRFGTYSGTHRYVMETFGGGRRVSIYHDRGSKWSLFLQEIFKAIWQKYAHTAPQISITESSVVMNFTHDQLRREHAVLPTTERVPINRVLFEFSAQKG